MSCSSSVLPHEKNLQENESMDWILIVAFQNLKKIMPKNVHVFRKPQMLFPIIFLLE